MRLGEVLEGCDCESIIHYGSGVDAPQSPVEDRKKNSSDVEISGIVYDSRKIPKGALFVAIKGDRFDGHDYIVDAVGKGAAAVVYEGVRQQTPPYPTLTKEMREGVINPPPVFIRVADSRKALACIANNFYERPSEVIPVVGVTGTNGKTTTTYLLKSILEAWGKDVGLIGTIRYLIKDREYPADYTTPESAEFQGLLRRMVSAGCSCVITEVSSHALSQKRVDYTKFTCAVFTNLTRDHLDFHGTMERYFAAKKRLFTELLQEGGNAAVNSDDAWGRRLIREIRSKTITFGINSEADLKALNIENTFSGLSFALRLRDGRVVRIDSPLIGTASVHNILAAAAAAVAMDVPLDIIREGIRTARPVEGRLETVDEGQDFLCIVDYAHTPDALERLLATARELISDIRDQKSETGSQERRVITVFGCGGNRDRGKRPVMGEIACRLSDKVFITSDNPRNEDPLEIIKEIESGIIDDRHFVVPDRKEAITMAIEMACDGDIVILAGKGHEEYQEIGDRRYRFSDREVAREMIRKRLEGTLDTC